MCREDLEKLADELVNRVEKYVDDILTGKINACKKHKWACERYLKDKENEEYVFDKIELLKIYIWSKQFKHRAGVLKGQYIELTDFNLFVLCNIFCWKIKETGLRRIKKVYVQLARKNMKTQLMGIISSYIEFINDKEQQEIYLAGWDKEQSSILYREIEFQLDTSSKLKNKFKKSYGKITNLSNGSFIKPLSREARTTGDGTNPSVGIVEEYHCHKTSEIYDVILSGMVSREEPLMVIITTAGFDLNRPCYKEYQYVSKVLDPDIKDVTNEEYFIMICELEKDDDIKNESNWIKANPIVATYEGGINFIRGELNSALGAPEKMRNFLTKNMNMWVSMRDDGYLDMSKWNEAEEDVHINEFSGQDCVLGIDLSNTLDLTSVAFEFYRDDKYYIFQHSFIPEETYQKRMREGRYRFDLWVEEGNLTVLPGASVDYNYVRNYIREVEEENNIHILECVYDPWNASQFVQNMYDEGYVMVEMRQGALTMNEPTKDFREKVYNKELIHGKDGLLSWAASNAVATQNSSEYTKVDKKASNEKIDPLIASICSQYGAMKILSVGQADIFYSPSI